MTNRRAIQRAREIVAECPHDGTCSSMQTHRGCMWLSCGLYAGIEEDEQQGTMVRCRLDDGAGK